MKFRRVSWDELAKLSIQLAKKLPGEWVWGIPRGGQLVAALMSYYGCQLVANYCRFELNPETVIVDDITDTGRTLAQYQHRTATLFVRENCSPYPTIFGRIIESDAYVLFPYEDEKEVLAQLKQGKYRTNDL